MGIHSDTKLLQKWENNGIFVCIIEFTIGTRQTNTNIEKAINLAIKIGKFEEFGNSKNHERYGHIWP
jgi:hypothetical protein